MFANLCLTVANANWFVLVSRIRLNQHSALPLWELTPESQRTRGYSSRDGQKLQSDVEQCACECGSTPGPGCLGLWASTHFHLQGGIINGYHHICLQLKLIWI